MKALIYRYAPYLLAAFMVANGFYTLAAGLKEVFPLDQYLALENAVPLIMGANIGTTATALIACSKWISPQGRRPSATSSSMWAGY